VSLLSLDTLSLTTLTALYHGFYPVGFVEEGVGGKVRCKTDRQASKQASHPGRAISSHSYHIFEFMGRLFFGLSGGSEGDLRRGLVVVV